MVVSSESLDKVEISKSSMQLELLSKYPSGGRSRKTAVLLIHGICLGGWVWQENFLPFFADRGFPTYALSLRGHGGSDGAHRMQEWGLKDFSDDLAWAVGQIDGPVVIVGHSMGGGVAQYYLRRGGHAEGMVLLASAPPHGLLRASMTMYSRNHRLWDELYRARSGRLHEGDRDIIERGLLAEPSGQEGERAALFQRLSQPAVQAGLELMGWSPFAPIPWLTPPLLVIGGRQDEFIPPSDVEMTGAYYGTKAHIIENCGHVIMLEKAWREAADIICAWMIRRFEVDPEIAKIA